MTPAEHAPAVPYDAPSVHRDTLSVHHDTLSVQHAPVPDPVSRLLLDRPTVHVEPPARAALRSLHVDLVDVDGAVRWILHRLTGPRDAAPIRVFTANLHHVDMLRTHDEFRAAYRSADLVLADGWPVALAASLRSGRRQPRATGSDLLPALAAAASLTGLSIGLLGGRPDAAAEAARRLTAQHPRLRVAVVEPAPVGFDRDPEQLRATLGRVRAAAPDILFVGLGAPKQELFAARHGDALGARCIVAVGAGLDFAGGRARRAPRLVQRLGLEWLHRAVTEPRRLVPRYARCVVPLVLELAAVAPALALQRRAS